MKCSNCEKETPHGEPVLQVVAVKSGYVSPEGPPTAWICAACQENVLTLKIVLKRESPKAPFKFEQYLAVENVKG